jgi:hypothetical protein
MSAWRINRVFEREPAARAQRDLAIAVVSWLAVLALISAVIADVFD